MKKSKGQLITVDFILAMTILIVIIQLSTSAWNKTVTGLNEKDQRTGIESLAFSVSHLLIKTPGIPGDWNSSNVAAIGLAEESNVIDTEKLNEFIGLDYSYTKELLGVSGYEFYFEIKNITGDIIGEEGMLKDPVAYIAISEGYGLDVLNGSSFVWDFYWCSSNEIPVSTARNTYQVPNQKQCFGDMIENMVAYNSILAEDPGIAESDFQEGDQKLNETHKAWLKSFVLEGNRYVQDEHGSVVCMFNMSGCGESKGTVGIVESLEYLVNLSIGEEVLFKEAPSALFQDSEDNDLNTIISSKEDPSRTLFGYWEYGNGTVFYIADLEDVVEESLIRNLNYIETILNHGNAPYDAENVVNSRRVGLLDNQLVYMDVILWK